MPDAHDITAMTLFNTNNPTTEQHRQAKIATYNQIYGGLPNIANTPPKVIGADYGSEPSFSVWYEMTQLGVDYCEIEIVDIIEPKYRIKGE